MGHARDTTTIQDHGPDTLQPGRALQGKDAPSGAQGLGSPQMLRDVAEQVRESFFREMDSAELVLIDVDPLVLHAFWRIPLSRFRDAQSALGPDDTLAPMYLSIEEADEDGRDLSGSPDVFDVRVSGLQSRAYIDVHSTGRCFRAVLGLRGKDGVFVELARSNVARLPPLGPSGQRHADIQHQPTVIPAWPATQSDTADLTEQPGQTEERADRGPPMPPESSVPQPGEAWPQELLAPHPLPQAAAVDLQPGNDGDRGDVIEPPQPSDAPSPQEHEAFALDEILPISSYVLAGSGDDVDLEVTAELHIYGRAKPGRAVQLCGKPVRLRPDGSFSIRRILPNDPQLISALLESTDAPEREGNG